MNGFDRVDWAEVVGVVCITLLAILTIGEPDLLDAIIHRVMEGGA